MGGIWARSLAGALLLVLLVAPAAVALHGPIRPGPGALHHGAAPAGARISTDAVPLPSAALPALPPEQPVRLTLALDPAHGSELLALDRALADPASPEYGKFLTPAEFAARFTPPVSNTTALERYFAGFGASGFSATSDHLGLSFELPAGGLPGALGLTARAVGSSSGGLLYDAPGTPTLPPGLSGSVLGIGGLSNLANPVLARELARGLPGASHRVGPLDRFVTVAGTQVQLLVGSDLTQAYGVSALFPGGASVLNRSFPTNEAVATILLSSYNYTYGIDLPPFDPAVISQYFHDTFPPTWPVPEVVGVPVPIANTTPPPPGPFGVAQDDLLSEAENSLDLEMAGSMAPGALLENYYFSAGLLANSTSTAYGSVAADFATCLASALDGNYFGHRLVAVTNSYGLPDLNDSLWNVELEHAAALGVTVLAASGDQGNAPADLTGRSQGPAPGWPATVAFDGYGVLAGGGTQVTLAGLPTAVYDPALGDLNVTFDPRVSGIASEAVWYDTSLGAGRYAGSEGGISSTFPEPGFERDSAAQPAIVNATLLAGDSQLGRALPDLALDAENLIAYDARNATGTYFDVLSGTSASSPLAAGLLATVSAVLGHPLGYLDPTLYRMGSYYAAHPKDPSPFRAILSGANYLYAAGPGWTPVAGWGSINAALLPAALADPAVAGYQYTGPTPGLPPSPDRLPPPALTVPPTPWTIWAATGIAAVGLVGALLVAMRYETPMPSRPTDGALGLTGSGAFPSPLPPRPSCPACRRVIVPWLSTCPWCGAPQRPGAP